MTQSLPSRWRAAERPQTFLSFGALVVAVRVKVFPQAWRSKCCWSASHCLSWLSHAAAQLSKLFVSEQPCLPFDPQQSLKIQLCRAAVLIGTPDVTNKQSLFLPEELLCPFIRRVRHPMVPFRFIQRACLLSPHTFCGFHLFLWDRSQYPKLALNLFCTQGWL